MSEVPDHSRSVFLVVLSIDKALTCVHCTDAGEGTIRRDSTMMSALQELSSNPLTPTEVKADADLCLRNINRSSRTLKSPVLRWSNGRLGF